jgi:hypothetical protein
MKRDVKNSLRSFFLEFVVYAVMVVAYYFLVLHLLGGWLNELFRNDRRMYAGVALVLIIAQGILLEMLTRLLLGLIKLRTEDR